MKVEVLKVDDGLIELEDPRDFLHYRAGSGNAVEIFDIQVGSERRKGNGRKLVNILIKRLPPGCTRIYAITRAENKIAQQFYTELRFVPIPLFDFYGVHDERGVRTVDAILYMRDLRSQA